MSSYKHNTRRYLALKLRDVYEISATDMSSDKIENVYVKLYMLFQIYCFVVWWDIIV